MQGFFLHEGINYFSTFGNLFISSEEEEEICGLM